MYLQTLGKLAFVGGEISRPKVLTMLAYLSLEGTKERGHLGDLFYMGASDPRSSLRISLKHIRDLADGVISSEHNQVGLEIASDASELLKALESHDYQKTIELYQGAFLENFRIKGASIELEEWVFDTREYLALGVRRAVLELATQTAQTGDFNEAANLAAKAFKLAGAPEPEPEQFRQLHALMLAGDVVEVLELEKLAAEYDIELNLTREEAKAQFYTTPINTAAPQAETSIQTESKTSPKQKQGVPEKSVTKPTNMRPRNNLFIGRSKELEEISSLLQNPDHRLVTLHGQGGIGKTRLVTHTGLDLLSSAVFPDGIYFVALENLSDGSQIVPAIATNLGLTLSTEKDEVDALAEQIGDKDMLIILDNFEHLMDSSIICSDLLKRSPNVKFLVSSREGLNLAGEVVYEVAGFSPPTSEQLSMELALDYDVIQLFIDRAKHANLSYKLTDDDLPHVIKICQMVEGLPLGVELAAAGLRYMPMSEIAESIAYDLDTLYMPARDKAERHHSIRATIEYSWKLLSAKEQQVLVNMAVFRGGFSRDAANKVAGASLPILRSLVDKALVRTSGDGRFTRHMLLYQYTVEKFLQDANHSEIQEKHANYFMQYSEEAEPQLIAENQVEWLNKLETEHENLRISLQWNLENDIEDALKQSAALRRFWEIRGYFVEGNDWYTKILEKTSKKDTEIYLKTLYAASALLRVQDNIDIAKVNLERCQKLATELNQQKILADTINQLAGISWAENDLESAHQLLEQSLEIKRSLNDKRGIAISLNNLGLLANTQNNSELAKTLYTESLGIYKSLADKKQMIGSFRAIGNVYDKNCEFENAKVYFDKALMLAIKLEDKFEESRLLNDIGSILCFQNQFEEARALLLKGEQIARESSIERMQIRNSLSIAAIEFVTGDILNATQKFRDGLRNSFNGNYKILVAHALEGIAHLKFNQKMFELAAVFLGASETFSGEDDLQIKHFSPQYYAGDHILESLGEQQYKDYFSKGKKLSASELLVLTQEDDISILN